LQENSISRELPARGTSQNAPSVFGGIDLFSRVPGTAPPVFPVPVYALPESGGSVPFYASSPNSRRKLCEDALPLALVLRVLEQRGPLH
jgi:hypothetical protein